MNVDNRGFSLMELMAVISVVSVLSVVAAVHYGEQYRRTQVKECFYNRAVIGRMNNYFAVDYNRGAVSIPELAQTKYLEENPKCPAKGVYVLMGSTSLASGMQYAACSLHGGSSGAEIAQATGGTGTTGNTGTGNSGTTGNTGTGSTTPPAAPVVAPLTSLGSSFDDITGGLVALITKYKAETGKYPAATGEAAYTSLGLTSAEWKTGYNGMVYTPAGSKVGVRPDAGYVLTVTTVKGKVNTLNVKDNASIWYDLATSKWYFKNINSPSEVIISSLKVKKT